MSRPGVTVLEEETSAKGLPAYTLNSGFFLPSLRPHSCYQTEEASPMRQFRILALI